MIYKFAYISKQNQMCNKYAYVNSETNEFVFYTTTIVSSEEINTVRNWTHENPVQEIRLDSLTSWHVLIGKLSRDPKMKNL